MLMLGAVAWSMAVEMSTLPASLLLGLTSTRNRYLYPGVILLAWFAHVVHIIDQSENSDPWVGCYFVATPLMCILFALLGRCVRARLVSAGIIK